MFNIISFLDRKSYSLKDYIFLNYYWILTIGALAGLFFGIYWLADTFIGIWIYFLVFTKRQPLIGGFNAFDIVWCLIFIWSCVTWIFNDYPNQEILIIRCFSEQLAYMFCYWVVRKDFRLNVQTIIHSSYLPLLITALIGIYLFFYEPQWYVNRTKDFNSEFQEFEFKRLRSIFMDGYIIMYFSGIVLIYEIFLLASGRLNNLKEKIFKFEISSKLLHYILIFACLVAIFLGIQRSVIVSLSVCIVVGLWYTLRYSKLKNLRPILIIIILGGTLSVFSFSKMNLYQQAFYLEKITSISDGSTELAKERFFHDQINNEFYWIGDGVGRHNMYADKYNPLTSMRDGEYMKTVTEQGYVGVFLFGALCLFALMKSIRYFRFLHFEFAMMLFLLISMIGANPLSTCDKHCLIYWMIIGQISNFNKVNNYESTKSLNYCSNV